MNETPEQRRRTMKAVRSRDTKPEMVVRRFLHAKGLRYRLHERDLPGSPDIIFPGKKLVVFVHGCFWHQHPGCPASSRPKTNTEYWDKKLDRNVERDFSVIESLGYPEKMVDAPLATDLNHPSQQRIIWLTESRRDTILRSVILLISDGLPCDRSCRSK